jgi:hypothetical protein
MADPVTDPSAVTRLSSPSRTAIADLPRISPGEVGETVHPLFPFDYEEAPQATPAPDSCPQAEPRAGSAAGHRLALDIPSRMPPIDPDRLTVAGHTRASLLNGYGFDGRRVVRRVAAGRPALGGAC